MVIVAREVGLDAISSALRRISWADLALICLVYGVSLVLDTLGWRYTLVTTRPPPFTRLLAARCAGQAVNVVTAVGGVGGEAVKAWLLRRDLPYETTVPSLVLAKTAEVVGQTLLMATGILVAWATGAVGWALIGPMCYLLGIEVVAVTGFVLTQVSGGLGWAGRFLTWAGARSGVSRLDGALRDFYRSHWRSLLLSIGCHFLSWLAGALEALLILRFLRIPATVAMATIIEALGTGVRFATFFIPASLGTLEGANAAAFRAFGWAASDGLAFTLIRRGRQAAWIGLGLLVLLAMGMARTAWTGKTDGRSRPGESDRSEGPGQRAATEGPAERQDGPLAA